MAFISYLLTRSTLAPISVLLLMTPSATNVDLNSGLTNYLNLLMRNKIILRNVNTVERLVNSKQNNERNFHKELIDEIKTDSYNNKELVSTMKFRVK